MSTTRKRLLICCAIPLGLWVLGKLFPLIFPFLLGFCFALLAEPAVGLLSQKLSRRLAAGIGVTAVLLLVSGGFLLLAAIALRELGRLAGALPQLGQQALEGIGSLRDRLTLLTDHAPDQLRPVLLQATSGLFNSGSALVEAMAVKLPGVATSLLSKLPGSALSIGTAVLSGYMLSVRLPRLRKRLEQHFPGFSRLAESWKTFRRALWGWLKAQLKLSALCFGLLTIGFLLLRIPGAPIWAAVISLVDAIPILGTGTVLLPWALIRLFQGQRALALGLAGLYAVTLLSRSLLEPKLVGKHLGLDPLVTLVCLYIGCKLWGIGGIFLSPVLSVALRESAALLKREKN